MNSLEDSRLRGLFLFIVTYIAYMLLIRTYKKIYLLYFDMYALLFLCDILNYYVITELL